MTQTRLKLWKSVRNPHVPIAAKFCVKSGKRLFSYDYFFSLFVIFFMLKVGQIRKPTKHGLKSKLITKIGIYRNGKE